MSNATVTSLIDIFASPNQVFDRIREKSISLWLPLIGLLVLSAVLFGGYFMTVDMYQFMETSMAMSGQEIAQADFEQIMQGEQVIRIVSIASAIVGTVVVYLILALFFFLAATLVAEEKYSFGQFLSVVSWGSLPTLISFLSITITLLISDGFVYIALADKTSLASLLGMTVDSEYFDMASALSIATVWSYVLYGLGFARITRASAVTATIVGLIPPATQFGLTYIF